MTHTPKFLDIGNRRRNGFLFRLDMPHSNKCALRLSNKRIPCHKLYLTMTQAQTYAKLQRRY